MKIKEQIVLLLAVSISFCFVSFIFDGFVKDYSSNTKNVEVWVWFFSGFCFSMGIISFGFMVYYLPDNWNEKIVSFFGLSNENMVGFSNKTRGLVGIVVGMFWLFLSFGKLFIDLGYLT
ncbi:MAG: hypothetical protein GY797_06450 [Deltaproteobacteria bacterium]|nr:hypothetical protein [Deltaproteobacteria bacterium]